MFISLSLGLVLLVRVGFCFGLLWLIKVKIMYAFDYDAVIYDSAIHCLSCLPENVTEKDYKPIFADSEWDEYPTCDCCGKIHDYVKLIVRNNQKKQFIDLLGKKSNLCNLIN